MTIKEIATHLNVSTTTVSNVIHGKTKEVSKDTVERIQEYLKQVQYTPNITARNLAQNRSKIIGFVLKRSYYQQINLFTDPFVSELIGSVEHAIREAGYFMMLYISDDIDQIIRYVSGWNVDGLILFATSEEDTIQLDAAYHKPTVYIDTYFKKDLEKNLQSRVVNVGLDDELAVYEAVRYLIQMGHRRIGFISRNFTGVDAARLAGFHRALQEADIEIPEDHLMERYNMSEPEDVRSYDELAEEAAKFTAVVACSDSTAILLENALEEHGYHVPEDVSIIGFDDNSDCRFSRPPLTTVHQDIGRKGETAVTTLIGMINGNPPKEKNILLPTKLVERESVRKLQ